MSNSSAKPVTIEGIASGVTFSGSFSGDVNVVSQTPTNTSAIEGTASVTTSSAVVINQNLDRKKLFIQNTGTGFVRLSYSGTATLTSPIRLCPEVGTHVIVMEGGFIYQDRIAAISESGTNVLTYLEEIT